MTNAERAESLKQTLNAAGITTTAVVILGRFVHVDSFLSHSNRLQCALIEAGFEILKASDCLHLDGFNGFRVSARLKA